MDKGWEGERKKFLEDRGIESKEREKERSGEEDWFDRARKKEEEMQRVEKLERIGSSRFNGWYK